MAVIINEIEVVVEPPPTEAAAATAAIPVVTLQPEDVLHIVERRVRQSLRLWAH